MAPTPSTQVADVRSAALRQLTSGVYVLTICGPDGLHAATVTWVSQVSFQPPLVLIGLRRNSHLALAVRNAHRFALNILEAGQEALGERFFAHVTAAPDAADLAGLAYRAGQGHCPLLTDALAWLECRLVAEPASPGDHALLLGEVIGAGVRRAGAPLVLGQTPWAYGEVREVQ